MFRMGKSIETKSRLVVARGWAGGMGVTANEFGISFGSDRKVLKLHKGNSCTTLNILKAAALNTLKG